MNSIDPIRFALNRRPFRPFVIVCRPDCAGGTEHRVDHRNQVAWGNRDLPVVLVAVRDGAIIALELERIDAIRMQPTPGGSAE